MNGNVYTGVVVRTVNIPINEGSATSVQSSAIVHQEGPFVALTDENARAVILANAMIKAKVDIGNPAAPVEVRIQRF